MCILNLGAREEEINGDGKEARLGRTRHKGGKGEQAQGTGS